MTQLDEVERGSTGNPARRFLRSIESAGSLDRLAALLDGGIRRPMGGASGRILRGSWLGHALHPLLTDFPLGFWASAGILDVVAPDQAQETRRRLVGLGLLAALPTIAAGLAEWPTLDDRASRRLAVSHMVGNGGVFVLYLVSWARRRQAKRPRSGIIPGLAGGMLAIVTGYLGGHLSLGRGAGRGERWWSGGKTG